MNGETLDREHSSAQPPAQYLPMAIWIFLIGGLAVIAAVFAWKFANRHKFEAAAFVQFKGLDHFCPDNSQNFRATQKEYLLSRDTLTAALRKLGVVELATLKDENDPAGWLSRNLQVAFPGKSEIMKVSLAGASQKEIAMIVNAVVDAYMEEVVDGERKKREDRIIELKCIHEEKSAEMKNVLNELKDMADQFGIANPESLDIRQKNILAELALVRGELVRSQFELYEKKRELASAQAFLQDLENILIFDPECELPATWDLIQQRLAEDNHCHGEVKMPPDISLSQMMDEKYSERVRELRKEILRKGKADLERNIKILEEAIDLAPIKQAPAKEEMAKLRKEADRLGDFSIEDMQMRRAEIAHKQKALDTLASELDALRVEAKSSPRVTIISKAEVPE